MKDGASLQRSATQTSATKSVGSPQRPNESDEGSHEPVSLVTTQGDTGNSPCV